MSIHSARIHAVRSHVVRSRAIRIHAARCAATLLLLACGGPSGKTDSGGSSPAAAKTAPVPAPVAEGMTAGSIDSPCGPQGVLVTFSAASFTGVNAYDTAASLGRLRTLATRAALSMRDLVTRTDYSPAIRTVRFALRDSAAVRLAVASLAKAPDVSEVALDACALTIQRKTPGM